MTYIDYINLFWKTSQNVKFSSNEAYLYFFLLSECNIRGWENPFECPNRRIILSIGISEPTLIDCRNRLQSKGLLMFESGKRNEKSPVYYLNDLSKQFSKTFSKRFSKDLSKNLSKDPSILYKTKEYKTIDLDNIPPTPPKGVDKAKEKELLEKEKALCALEEELKKREAELDAQSDKPPSKLKKRPPELMPRTKDASVSILGTLPMPYYNSLHPKTVNDVFDSPSCSIAVINKKFGEQHLRAFMVKVLNDLLDFFNVGKTMGAVQVASTADLIIEEFYFLKPDDFKLCFTRAKKGYYGKVFDRIDGQVIFEWLNQYTNDRMTTASDTSIQEAERFKDSRGERTSSLLEAAEHDFKKYDFERKYKV